METLPDEQEEQVTPPANPADEQVAGSQPGQTQEDGSPPASGDTSDPSEAYKGMQRLVSKKDKEIAELRAQVSQSERSPENDEMTKLETQRQQAQTQIDALRRDPERASEATEAQLKLDALYNQRKLTLVEEERDQAQRYAEYERTEVGNIAALRDLASDLGADPDSPMIDYGDPTKDYLSDRMTMVRESARAATAPATPVTPPKATIADGSAHTSNPGTPPNTDQPAPTPVPSRGETSKLLTDRANTPTAANVAAVDAAMDVRKAELERQLAYQVAISGAEL